MEGRLSYFPIGDERNGIQPFVLPVSRSKETSSWDRKSQDEKKECERKEMGCGIAPAPAMIYRRTRDRALVVRSIRAQAQAQSSSFIERMIDVLSPSRYAICAWLGLHAEYRAYGGEVDLHASCTQSHLPQPITILKE